MRSLLNGCLFVLLLFSDKCIALRVETNAEKLHHMSNF